MLSITGEDTEIGELNPTRYRGYYQDTETGLYYLQSRYYDPTTMRFINADDPNIIQMGTEEKQELNLYVYCLNDPVNSVDPTGYFVVRRVGDIINGVANIAGFAWDSRYKCWYSLNNAWQRTFEYCDLYDTMAPLAGIFISHKKMPVKYGGKEWMIWIWKGQYGIMTGAEVGVYIYSKTYSVTYFGKTARQKWYRSANRSEELNIEFTLYKNGQVLIYRPYQKHWWVTGFKFGFNKAANGLRMKITINFKGVAMARAFCSQNRLPSTNSSKITFWW